MKRPRGGPCELEEQTSERAGRRSAAVEPGLGRVTNLFGVTIVLIDMSRRGTYAFVYCFCVTTRPSMACLLPICKVLTVYVWSASTDRPSPLFEVPSAPRVRHRYLCEGARWKGKGNAHMYARASRSRVSWHLARQGEHDRKSGAILGAMRTNCAD